MQHAFGHRPSTLLAAPRGWLAREWRVLRFGALAVVATLSPRLWHRATRREAAQFLCAAAWRTLPGYLLLTALVTAVLTRVVVVTAASYGLSHLALEAVVRVFVMELLPLATALFVATRSGLDAAAMLARARAEAAPLNRIAALVAANGLAVVALFVISGAAALVTAYLTAHGPSPWGLAAFTRMVGQVFDPVTAQILALKVALFAAAVAVAPTSVTIDAPRRDVALGEMRVMARALLLILLVEAAALALRQI